MRSSATAAVLALSLLLAAVAGAEEEDRPQIFLEKKVFSEDSRGKKSFYEAHTVSRGESLWKILSRRVPLSPPEYAEALREVLRANPRLSDPSRLRPGQRILVPANPPRIEPPAPIAGKSEAYRVARGDTLSGVLSARGVRRGEMKKYLDAVKELNRSVKDVNRIRADRTLLLPTEGYFAEEGEAPAAVAAKEEPPAKEPEKEPAKGPSKEKEEPPAPAPAAAAAKEAEAALPVAPLTKEAPPEAPPGTAPTAKPEGELKVAAGPNPPASAVVSKTGEKPAPKAAEESSPKPVKPPYRGLLSDLLRGLGEKWVDRGTLYLPIPSGGEATLSLEDYPVAQFSTGISALIDFRGALPRAVRDLIGATWKGYRVVSMEGAAGPAEMIDRLLASAGYYSVKDALANPLVVGEGVSVTLPARWVVLKTADSLLKGEVILVKGVPEKPSRELAAAIRYGEEVGIRTLGFAFDPSAREGFLVGIDEEGETPPEAPRRIPPGGLPAVDFALGFAGFPKTEGEKINIGGKDKAFQLVVAAERIFEAGGRKIVVDTGRLTPALRTLVRGAGYEILSVGRDESGRDVFLKVLRAGGLATEERRGALVAGGEGQGFDVRVSGTFIVTPTFLADRRLRAAAVVRGKIHPATDAFLRSLGVEIVGW